MKSLHVEKSRLLSLARSSAALLLAGTVLSGCAILSGGESSADIYIGPNIPQDEEVTSTVAAAFTDDDFDGEMTVGARIGHWITPLAPLNVLEVGAYLDVSGVLQDIDNGDYSQVPISLIPMVRVPLVTSEDFPHGRVQPYVGVGPSVVWNEIDVSTLGDEFNSTDVAIGIDMRAGVTLMLLKHFGVFTEYRLTHSEPDFEDDLLGVPEAAEAETLLHHVLFGATLRF